MKGIHSREDVEEIAERIGNDVPYYLQSYSDAGDILKPEASEYRFRSRSFRRCSTPHDVTAGWRSCGREMRRSRAPAAGRRGCDEKPARKDGAVRQKTT